MYRENLFILTLFLICQISLSALVCEGQKNFEDPDEVAKQVEKNFKYVKYDGNFTTYLVNDMVSPLSLAVGNHNPPDFLDWRDKGKIGPIKDQGRCGACWAFAAAACIESHLAIYTTNPPTILSEQFLIDCVRNGNDDAPKCGDYSLLKAYSDIIMEFGGVLASGDYRPYSGFAGECSYKGPPPYPLKISGFKRVDPDEDKMVLALFKYGPISAAINSKSMDNYHQNNYIDEPTEEQCPSRPENMDHAILIIGYNVYVGQTRKVPYWIIKNSWGEQWGDKGYYYLVRGRNACGIRNDVSFAIVQ